MTSDVASPVCCLRGGGAGLKQGLAELGCADGQTVVFETRFADGKFALLPDLADDVVQLPVDIIVTVGGAAARRLRLAALHQAFRSYVSWSTILSADVS
jgi:hypothetical protein